MTDRGGRITFENLLIPIFHALGAPAGMGLEACKPLGADPEAGVVPSVRATLGPSRAMCRWEKPLATQLPSFGLQRLEKTGED